MPARKHREGAALEDWLSRKAQQSQKMEMARLRVQSLTRHILLKPIEAAAMLGVTRKTLREMEARGELPPRITFSAKVFGWRLSDMEALLDRMDGGHADQQVQSYD
jgi:predicted DNA-binding transcriptional regulator AlpA